MALFTEAIIRNLLSESLETASLTDAGWKEVEKGASSKETELVDCPYVFPNEFSSVIDDVKRIRNHPFRSRGIYRFTVMFTMSKSVS
jgi:carbonic anhydrase